MAGYREFTTGQVLTAGQVNEFLMEQSTMTFDDASARTTALSGVLREGLLTYNLDAGRLEVYDGTDWVEPAPEIAGIGSNVVQTAKADTFSSSSTGIFDITGFSVTITPTSASSKVLVLVSATLSEGAADSNTHGITIADGDNNNLILPTSPSSRSAAVAQQFVPVTNAHQIQMSYTLLHSPATTSAFTYKVRAFNSGGTFYLNRNGGDADVANTVRSVSTITAIEVSA